MDTIGNGQAEAPRKVWVRTPQTRQGQDERGMIFEAASSLRGEQHIADGQGTSRLDDGGLASSRREGDKGSLSPTSESPHLQQTAAVTVSYTKSRHFVSP